MGLAAGTAKQAYALLCDCKKYIDKIPNDYSNNW
jgi:hypothetical protein